jgi:regulator of nucleoside diphosphate kinase
MTRRTSIYLTSQDAERLERLLASTPKSENVRALGEELESAVIVEPLKIPRDVVTMNSQVHFRDEESDQEQAVTIVYPHAAEPLQGRVSVLAPVGSALLGLSVGDVIEWPVPRGRTRRLRITSIAYQPEAAGDLDL